MRLGDFFVTVLCQRLTIWTSGEVTMNRLNTSSSTLIYSAAAPFDPGPVRRLIVLIPTDSDYTSTMGRISDLAITFHAQVLFLGLCKDATDELSLRRELVTLSALLEGPRVYAEARVEMRTNWVDIVRSNYQTGDLIVCFAEQRAGLLHRPLSQILASNLGMPVYILSTLGPQRSARSGWLSKVTLWAGFVGIIAGAFLLQVQMMSIPGDRAQTVMLIISVLVELWLIWAWNRLFS